MVGDVPAWFVDVINWDTLAEVVLDHLVHKCDVFLFVFVVSLHFTLQIFESLFDHGEVSFQRDDRFLARHWYLIVAIWQVLAVSGCVQKLLVLTRKRGLFSNIVEILFHYVDELLGVWISDLSLVHNRRSFAAGDAIAEDCVDIAGRLA